MVRDILWCLRLPRLIAVLEVPIGAVLRDVHGRVLEAGEVPHLLAFATVPR